MESGFLALKASVLRTLTPIIYALLLKAGFGSLGVENEVINSIAAGVAAVMFYVAIRVLERARSSRWGWLIGYGNAVPVYQPQETSDTSYVSPETSGQAPYGGGLSQEDE